MYSYTPKLRFTPPGGLPVVADLTLLDRIIEADVIWTPLFEQFELIDRSIQTERYGWRLAVKLSIFATHGSATDLTIQNNLSYWLNRSDTATEITMDGTYYRTAHLTGWKRTKPKKKNIGNIYEMILTCEKVIHEDALPPEGRTAPPIMEGWA